MRISLSLCLALLLLLCEVQNDLRADIPELVDDGYGNRVCPICGALCDCPYTPACNGRPRYDGTRKKGPRLRGAESKASRRNGAESGFESSAANGHGRLDHAGQPVSSTTGSSESMAVRGPASSLVNFTKDRNFPAPVPPTARPKEEPRPPQPPEPKLPDFKSPTIILQ